MAAGSSWKSLCRTVGTVTDCRGCQSQDNPIEQTVPHGGDGGHGRNPIVQIYSPGQS